MKKTIWKSNFLEQKTAPRFRHSNDRSEGASKDFVQCLLFFPNDTLKLKERIIEYELVDGVGWIAQLDRGPYTTRPYHNNGKNEIYSRNPSISIIYPQ